MSTLALPTHPPKLRTIHLLLTLQTLVIILGSLNRLGPWTLGYVAPNEFLRWVDLFNMLPIPMLSIAASGALFYGLAYDNGRYFSRWHQGLGLLFLLAVYLFGASYGNHEVTNYLNSRFCIANPLSNGEDLCRIVIYNDDDFSHALFFAAFVAINTILMGMQLLFPQREPLSVGDSMLLCGNALFIALGVMANLAFETIGLDLYVIVGLALLSVALLWRYGRQPLLLYYAVAYGLGLGLTVGVVSIGY